MTARTLTSDHVNYLVWRYLQEFGYGEAAVRLQRNWNLRDPQSLPFAGHVKAHALVSLIQKGLLYHELEQTIDQARHADPRTRSTSSCRSYRKTNVNPLSLSLQYGHPTVTTEASYFFGPDAAFNDKAPDCQFEQRAESLAAARRQANGLARAEDSVQTPPPTKRNRRTNGIENGDGMELDHNSHGHRHHGGHAATDARTAAAARTATRGQSVAIQVDRVAELGRSETEFISPGSAVLSCVWNPVDPTALALKSETRCQIWRVARAHPPHALAIDEELMRDITTAAWSPHGELLATGAYDGFVSLWTVKGALVRRMHPVGQGAVFRLRWNDDGSCLLGITGDGLKVVVAVWNTKTGYALNSVRKVFSATHAPLFDIVWVSHSEFVVGGHQTLHKYEVRNEAGLPFGVACDDAIVLVRSDGGGLLATASENGYVKLWDAGSYALLNVITHPSQPSCLEWQPLAPSHQAQDKSSTRIFATGSDDGIVRLWDGRAPGGAPLHRFEFGSPILALAFSPDGYFIAAASPGKVMIWNAEEGGLPRAFWMVKNVMDHNRRGTAGMIKQDPGHEDPSWADMSPNGGAEWPDEQFADLSLSWDADGKRLALGVGKQVAIIKFG